MASSSTSSNANNSTLLLTDVPADQNTAINLCNHFCKFGKVLWIETAFNGNPNSATVQFDTQAEASKAINSNEPLLNNRFIKMSWVCTPNSGPSSAATSTTPQNDDRKCSLCAREFASSWHRDNHVKRFHSGGGIKCNECDASFTSANMYKKHCSVQHSDAKKPFMATPSPASTVKSEGAVPKFDYSMAEKIVLLRLRVKSLKKVAKKNAKANAKTVKTLEKKKQLIEKQLKGWLAIEKDAFCFQKILHLNDWFWYCLDKDNMIKDIIKEKDDLLKNKESVLTSVQQSNVELREQNYRLHQSLKNERQKVEMLHETLSVLVNLNNSE